jgi:hypothetical protein
MRAWTVSEIHEAFEAVNAAPAGKWEAAHELILRWRDTPQSIVQAIALICSTASETVIYQAACVCLLDIESHWLTYIAGDRLHIRNSLCDCLFGFTGTKITLRKLIELVVAIALKDWPDSWPDCLDYFIGSMLSSVDVCILDLCVISALLSAITTSRRVTNFRRRRLIELFNSRLPNLLDVVKEVVAGADLAVVGPALCELFEPLCPSSPPDLLVRPGFIATLINQFVATPDTSESATRALSNLLLDRADAATIVADALEEVVEILSGVVSEDVPSHFLSFITRFLGRHCADLENLCFPGEDPDAALVEWATGIFLLILRSAPPDGDFWWLWRWILGRYARASNSANRFSALRPVVRLFGGLIDDIRSGLLPVINPKDADCCACLVFAAACDKAGIVKFLLSQPLSVSLCHAVGLVDCCLPARSEHDLLARLLPALVAHDQTEQSIEFRIALLFAMSHAVRFLARCPDVLDALLSYLNAFLNAGERRVQAAAVNAVLHIALRRPALLAREPAIGLLLAAWRSSSLDGKLMVKLSNALGRIIDASADRTKLYADFFAVVDRLLDSSEFGLDVVRSITRVQLRDSLEHFVSLLDHLSASLSAASEDQLAGSIAAMTDILCAHPFKVMSDHLVGFVRTLIEIPDFHDIALDAAAKLRRSFVQVDVFYNDLFAAHIGKDQEVSAASLRFLRKFGLRDESLAQVWAMATAAIGDELGDVARKGGKLLVKVLGRLCNEGQNGMVVDKRSELLAVVFGALTDGFHLDMFREIAEIMCLVFQAMSVAGGAFDGEVVEQLKKVTGNAEVAADFAVLLRRNWGRVEEVMKGMNEFLVAIRCASASDRQLFEKGFEMDAMMKELMSMVVPGEKEAVDAKKYNLLGSLKKFKI